MLKEWIDESYRAQAPKKFLKQLDGGASATPVTAKQTATKAKASPKKPARKAANKPTKKRVA
jgi:hypothetical protein